MTDSTTAGVMDEIERVRVILAGTNIGGSLPLPSHMTVEQMAQARMDDIAVLREATQEELYWKSRLLDKIARLEAELSEHEMTH